MFKPFKPQPQIKMMRFFVPQEDILASDGSVALTTGRDVVVQVSEQKNRPPRLWVMADEAHDSTFRILG